MEDQCLSDGILLLTDNPSAAQPEEDTKWTTQGPMGGVTDVHLSVTSPSISHPEKQNQPSSISKMAKCLEKPIFNQWTDELVTD